MIVFDLKCEENHVFEAWFQNSDTYETQAKNGQIECPYCGSSSISKSVMSPNISAKSNSSAKSKSEDMASREIGSKDMVSGDHLISASANVPDTMAASAEDVKRALDHMHTTMKKFRNHVKNECEYVGEKFADEARAIHEGTAENRGIYGEATLEETEELLNDGIEVLPVPGLDKLDS